MHLNRTNNCRASETAWIEFGLWEIMEDLAHFLHQERRSCRNIISRCLAVNPCPEGNDTANRHHTLRQGQSYIELACTGSHLAPLHEAPDHFIIVLKAFGLERKGCTREP